MNTLRVITLFLLTALLCGVVFASDESVKDPAPLFVYGKAYFCRDGKTWQQITNCTTFKGNDWISVSPKSNLVFSINGTDTISLCNGSVGALYPPAAGKAPELWNEVYLQYGCIWVRAGAEERKDVTYSLVTPQATVTTKGAVFVVVKGKNNSQPEEFWVFDGSVTLVKKNQVVVINKSERVIVMADQDLPARASRFDPKNSSAWYKWNENKDKLITKGDYKGLEATRPPEMNWEELPQVSSPSQQESSPSHSTGSSSQTKGSTQQSTQPAQGEQQGSPSQQELQELHDRMRVPPAYDPSF